MLSPRNAPGLRPFKKRIISTNHNHALFFFSLFFVMDPPEENEVTTMIPNFEVEKGTPLSIHILVRILAATMISWISR